MDNQAIFKMIKCKRFPSLIGMRQSAAELASLAFRDEESAFDELCGAKLDAVINDDDGDQWMRIA